MYLKSVEVENLRCFDELGLDLSSTKEENGIRRWTALLGENGVGKSTLLKAIASALAGPAAVRQLLLFPETWVRTGAIQAEIKANIQPTDGDLGADDGPRRRSLAAWFVIRGHSLQEEPAVKSQQSIGWEVGLFSPHPDRRAKNDWKLLANTMYSEQTTEGWLACGYGPFRRLSGGAEVPEQIIASSRRSARFVTLFYESAALTDVQAWLVKLYNLGRDGDRRSQRRLKVIQEAFQERLLPYRADLHVDASRASLAIGGRENVGFDDLSDGYRSMLALGLDLIRWLTTAFPDCDDPMERPGVVLIDELDAHLHPRWQREIGFWLLDKFPCLQFIVATHSPFLAQVASEAGGNVVLERTEEGVRARSGVEAVDTWRADQILSELFDLDSSRSPKVERDIEEFQELHLKYQRGSLEGEEKRKHQQLLAWVESLPTIQDPEERRLAAKYSQAVKRYSAQIEEALK
jgi:hypothetical protein